MQFAKKWSFCLGTLLVAWVCFPDTVRAQSTTLTATPPQLTFNAQTGVTPATQTVTISSSSGATNISVAAFSSGNWLMVTPTSGTTPLQLTVSVNPAASTLATDNGFLNISAAGAFLSVRVELNVNSPGPSPLSAIPNSLSFTFAANATVPVTKSVALASSDTSVTTFTATSMTNNGGSWLTVSPTSGSLPATLQVTANPVALTGAGPFNAVVAINAPGTTGISLPVLVTVAGTPAISVSPGQLNFAWQIGTTPPAAQTLAITSSTGVNVSFTAAAKTSTCGDNWLVISPQSGATPGSISVQVNTSGLTANQCTGEIDISAPGASNPSVAIQVGLLVSTKPLLLVPTTGPTFTYQIGASTQLAAQNVQITSSSTALNFTVSAAPATAGGPDFLTVTPAVGATPQSLELTVKSAVLATLGPGTYVENVTVTSADAGNSPQMFPVTLTVNSNPLLTASVSSLSFNYQTGQALPPSQTFTVSSTGAPLNFQVDVDTSNCSGFLTATANGGATGLTYGNQNQVLVSVNVTGIMPQACTGHITLSVPNSTTPALSIAVTLNVSSHALLNVSTGAINVTALVGAQASTQTVAVTSTDPATVLPFSATAATNPIGLTWLSVAPNSGNTPSNLLVTINPQNLAVGTYTGTLTVASSTHGVPAQTIQVTLVIVASSLSATPPSVTFTESFGATQAATESVQINGVPGGATVGVVASMLNGTGWLSAAVAGNSVTVTANAAQLAQGTYSGVVSVIVPGAGNSPLYIAVTLNVTAANMLTLSSSTVNFSYQAGGSIPPAQTVQIGTTGGSVPFTATFTPSAGSNFAGGAFLLFSPASGNTPATLSLTLNTAVVTSLAVGSYSGKLVISSPSLPGGNQTITVNLVVSAAGTPAVLAITNSASFVPGPVSPGELISIFGTSLGPVQGLLFTPDNGKVDTTLDDTVVMFGNVPAPLLYVSATQINAIVPYEVSGNTFTTVTVSHLGVVSAQLSVAVVATVPAIFSANQTGNGEGAILNQNLSANSGANPAPKGSIISIYATGEGALQPFVPTGTISGFLPLPRPVADISVTIGGQPAQISYAGEAPTLVSGVLQVNAMVPQNIGSGPQLVVLTIGANSNRQQSITAAIQ